MQTLTYGNGSEFAEHALIDIALEANAYFAEPHSPWQRGSNENATGLVRQYAPKGRSMHALTGEEIQIIEDKLNNRPRQILGFKTPREVFFASFKRHTSQLNPPPCLLYSSVIDLLKRPPYFVSSKHKRLRE